jgi:hypothetical protein
MDPPSEVRVLGSGPAGALAASRLARARLPVRWQPTPGRAGSAAEGDLLPADLAARLPAPPEGQWDRSIVLHRWLLLDGARSTGAEFREPHHPGLPVAALRDEVAGRCEAVALERGVQLLPAGPTGPPERPDSAATVLADPELSDPPAAREWLLSLRYDLPPERISSRFGLGTREGASVHWLGPVAPGLGAGGTLRTYRDCLLVSLLFWADGGTLSRTGLDRGRAETLGHPAIAPLLAGARLSAESVRPVGSARANWGESGLLRVGRAVGLEASNGMEVRGLPAELVSAEIAADVVSTALLRSPRLGDQTGAYAHRMRTDPSVLGLRDWASRGARLRATALATPDWNRFTGELFHRLMSEEGRNKRSVRSQLLATRRATRLGWPGLLRSAWNWWEAW